jgi:hypothetical protein
LCELCLCFKYSEEELAKHKEACENYFEHTNALPQLCGKTVKAKFKHVEKSIPVPFCIYMDLEALIGAQIRDGGFQHTVCSYAFQVVTPIEGFHINDLLIYTGKDVLTHLIDNLKTVSLEIYKFIVKRNEKFKKLILSPEDEMKFKQSLECHLCNDSKFTDKNFAVRDHCHITGDFRGKAHNNCNLKARQATTIKCIFHNGSNYDYRFVVREIYRISQNINVIPFTENRYLMFGVRIPDTRLKLEFIDSCKLLISSLDVLVNNVIKTHGASGLEYTYRQCNGEAKVLRKGHFPYEYMSSFEKLDETSLPPMEAFRSSLKEQKSLEEEQKDYAEAQEMWSYFKCKTMRDYLNAYLSLDVYLLRDVFERFRTEAQADYKLDPAWYYSAPGLTWDAYFKMTKAKIDLIYDKDMIYFYSTNIRGGYSGVMKRYVKANNKYLPDYNPSKPSTYLVYVDANNLYGQALSQPLPYKHLTWCDQEEIDYLFKIIKDIPDDSMIGFTIKCDIEYPKELHKMHNNYPFLPINRKVEYSELSDYQKDLIPGKHPTTNKLIIDLYDKKGVVIDYRILKQALYHGLKLTKIHSAICYIQKPIIKPYMDFNTERRIQAAAVNNKVGEERSKLMNNSIWEND